MKESLKRSGCVRICMSGMLLSGLVWLLVIGSPGATAQPEAEAQLKQAQQGYYKGVECLGKGEIAQAEECLQKSLKTFRQYLGKDDINCGEILRRLGLIAMIKGRYVEAEGFLYESSAIKVKKLGKDHPSTIATMSFMGEASAANGYYRRAEGILLPIVSISRKVTGEESHEYGYVLKCLGELFLKAGKLSEAESYFAKDFEIIKKMHGPEHPGYAVGLFCMGRVHLAKGEDALAEKELLESERILRGDPASQKVYIPVLLSLGKLSLRKQKLGDARRYAEEVVEKEKKFGEDRPACAKTLDFQGRVYEASGFHKEAEKCFARALEISEKFLHENHPDLAAMLERKAARLRQAGQTEMAAELESRVGTMRQRLEKEDQKTDPF